MSHYYLGIDLGGTKIRAGLASQDGTIVAQDALPTPSGDGLVEQIVGLTSRLCSSAGVERSSLVACGVGGAGVPDDTNGGFIQAPNIDGMHGLDFRAQLETALAVPVAIENDVNVAALGELHYGVGRTVDDFVFISVGTGIGMGIVAGGRLLSGASGAAGEIGFLPLGTDPLLPENHRRGPLEEMLAGDAIVSRYVDATGEHITTREVFARAQAGDAAALDAVDSEGRWLAMGIAAVAAILDPAVVVLGGGIGSRSDLVDSTISWLERLNVSTPIVPSELGQLAPVVGAVRLAIESLPSAKGTLQ